MNQSRLINHVPNHNPIFRLRKISGWARIASRKGRLVDVWGISIVMLVECQVSGIENVEGIFGYLVNFEKWGVCEVSIKRVEGSSIPTK